MLDNPLVKALAIAGAAFFLVKFIPNAKVAAMVLGVAGVIIAKQVPVVQDVI